MFLEVRVLRGKYEVKVEFLKDFLCYDFEREEYGLLGIVLYVLIFIDLSNINCNS